MRGRHPGLHHRAEVYQVAQTGEQDDQLIGYLIKLAVPNFPCLKHLSCLCYVLDPAVCLAEQAADLMQLETAMIHTFCKLHHVIA